VDLPGYGFAKIAMAKKKEWQVLMEKYLEQRKSLAALVLLVDSRHPFQPIDEVMLNWSLQYGMPCHILLTKSDKLSKNQADRALLAAQKLINGVETASVQLFSALSGIGLDVARSNIKQRLVHRQAGH